MDLEVAGGRRSQIGKKESTGDPSFDLRVAMRCEGEDVAIWCGEPPEPPGAGSAKVMMLEEKRSIREVRWSCMLGPRRRERGVFEGWKGEEGRIGRTMVLFGEDVD